MKFQPNLKRFITAGVVLSSMYIPVMLYLRESGQFTTIFNPRGYYFGDPRWDGPFGIVLLGLMTSFVIGSRVPTGNTRTAFMNGAMISYFMHGYYATAMYYRGIWDIGPAILFSLYMMLITGLSTVAADKYAY